MQFFYCPKCGFEEEVSAIPRDAVGNTRGGYGIPIYHYECPQCHNLDAGAMQLRPDKEPEFPKSEQKNYIRSVIEMYQDIRGIKD